MSILLRMIFISYCATFVFGCSKKDGTELGSTGPIISSLLYDPKTITIKLNSPTFTISGTLNFENASGGVSKLRLTNSAGADITVTVQPNSNPSGQITGTFEFVLPLTPGTFTFEIWIIDGKGKSSNKLSGSLQLVIDDSATKWTMVSQSWPLHRVIWANNKYIAVGEGGVILTSPNGVDWTSQNSGTTNTLYGVAWSGSKYVAVGNNMTILISPDGNNWTTRSSGNPDIIFTGVDGSGTHFTAVGKNASGTKTEIYNSGDGFNWSPNTFSVNGGIINSVRWTGNQYIAVGGANGYPLVLTSPNGIDWINRSSSLNVPGQLADVIYSGTKYAAVGYAVTAVSNDGINWSGNITNWGSAGITWSGKRFVASSIIGIMASDDGITWTNVFDSAYPLRNITWSGLQYVAVGFISPVILISP